ncbi:MAG: transposase [Chloroflexi bacterium]|nr:transposase [Chloroflexota bacterium]
MMGLFGRLNEPRPPLSQLYQQATTTLPTFVQASPLALAYLELLGPLAWADFPEPPSPPRWSRQPEPRAHFVAAWLIKIAEQKRSMPALRQFLVQNPALVWLLGFQLVLDPTTPWGFDADASLPCHRHFSRVLRELPNDACRFLLASTVQLLQRQLPPDSHFGDAIALDTKHILAWVVENNPKVDMPKRFCKERQPKGDPDCKLGCKQKKNKAPHATTHDGSATTPTQQGQPASQAQVGEYYWGYASGVVTTKVAGYGEFVLAELTQTFDHSDISYFFPLMAQTAAHLGRKPPNGALDKAFDAFYVHEYFHQAGGFAAVPWADRADHHKTFSAEGLPHCAAGLAMPLKSTFRDNAGLVAHQAGRYACPLLFPEKTGAVCPITHKNWPTGGCVTTLPTSIGTRLRHQLDRTTDAYYQLYNQRSAAERINSLALALGIERPKLRNQQSITNHNTLLYVILNLRASQRLTTQRTAHAPPI